MIPSVMGYYNHFDWKMLAWTIKRQVPIFVIFSLFVFTALGDIRYSIPEEMSAGSFIGNMATDLGVDIKRLKTGKARIYNEGDANYIELNVHKGVLTVKDRIDREQLCASISPCILNFQLILENPMELHRVIVEITDVNDNDPRFPSNNVQLEIYESSFAGARFLLPSAVDPDSGINSIQTYALSSTDHFNLKMRTNADGNTIVELLLKTSLDREKQEEHVLLLTALDGGDPRRSGTVEVHIIVLDANDNAPVFTQELYKATVEENSPIGASLIRVSATDADKGLYGKVTYHFNHVTDVTKNLFAIDPESGEIKVIGQIDYENKKMYELTVQAKDHGGHINSSKVIIEITDVNDNNPSINLMSVSSQIPEDSSPGTVIAIFKVQDKDSGKNGEAHCSIEDSIPFRLKSSLNNFYTLETDGFLDREKTPQYNITINVKDSGYPPLSASHTLTLDINDVNDNPPKFDKQHYTAYIMENNSPGSSFFALQATDLDLGSNGKIAYYVQETRVQNSSVSSYVSVNSDDGVLYAVRSFDFEQTTQFQVSVIAKDGGSPPLSATAVIDVFVQDQNDNAPRILYPVQSKGSLVAEMVPRSADVGYLVTKVVAVDQDSGQNAWLSYKIMKPADQTLFEIGLQNGEVRTLRQVTDKDSLKQRLTISVEDSGRPSLSATIVVNVAVTDGLHQALLELNDMSQGTEADANITFYLILALVIVSFLFMTFIIILVSVKLYTWRRSKLYNKCAGGTLPVIPYYPPHYADAVGTGTLRHVYNYEVCMTADSGKSEFKFIRPTNGTLVRVDPSGTETIPHTTSKNAIDEEDFKQNEEVSPVKIKGTQSTSLNHLCQKPANAEWRFTQGQRPGTSGTQRPEEAGPWPNPPTEAEQLQALMAAANEVSEATGTLGAGTMGLSTRYSPQFTLQHVPDYRQNVYIPGSTTTLAGNNAQPEAKIMVAAAAAAAPTANKKKPGKKEKK
uniref:Protocadherin gamma-C5-like n=1 Tax=Erpetoichthys calabaricus TaxID=27687 RepID=A0A8C4SEP7_ERPCA